MAIAPYQEVCHVPALVHDLREDICHTTFRFTRFTRDPLFENPFHVVIPHGGARSFGPTVAKLRHNDYVEWARDNVAVIPMIETAEALSNLDAIVQVDGIDAVYVGPADLSLTIDLPPGNNDGAAAFDDALSAIVEACDDAGVVPGIHASGPLTPTRLTQGFRLITVIADQLALGDGAAAALAQARGGSAPGGGALY